MNYFISFKFFLKKSLPNLITCSRLFLLAPTIMMFSEPGLSRILSFVLFIISILSDWLDGILARKLKLETKIGEFLDPLVDKIFIITFFIFITYFDANIFPFWIVWLIIIREFSVTLFRFLSYKKISLKAIKSGKIKTVMQFVSIISIYILLIIQDQVLIHTNSSSIELYSSFFHILNFWRETLGFSLGGLVSYFPTMILYFVAILTLYSGFDYIYQNKDYLLSMFNK